MRLVADRFAVDDEGRALDLATGNRVRVRVGAAGGVSEQLRWAERCAMFHTLHHRAIARLLDFGPLGESSRFEAWACAALSRGSRELASSVHAAATKFLHASGLTSAGLMPESVQRARNGAEVWVPPDLATDLNRLLQRTSGALALVSGRSLNDIDLIFAPEQFSAVGGHGAEMRLAVDGDAVVTHAPPMDKELKRRLAAIR